MTWVQSAAGAQFSWAGVTSRPGDTRRPGDEENCGRKHGDRSHTVSLAKLSDAPRESVRRGPSSSGPRQRQATVQEELPGGAQLRVAPWNRTSVLGWGCCTAERLMRAFARVGHLPGSLHE